MDSVSWPQNWYFLTFPKSFLAARGHSPRNPDAFRSSVPAYNPMGASRIVSAKKHFEKVSKYSALLYASSAHTVSHAHAPSMIASNDIYIIPLRPGILQNNLLLPGIP